MSQIKRPFNEYPREPSQHSQPNKKKPLLDPSTPTPTPTPRPPPPPPLGPTKSTITDTNVPRPTPPTFKSYKDVPNLPPKIKLLCEILSTTPPSSLEETLSSLGILLTPSDVESVLQLSYSHPGPAVKFLRWSSQRLSLAPSPLSWNLVVDLLGRNHLFDAMWDALKSMRSQPRLLSLSTFASVFASYASAHRPNDALLSFLLMDDYGVPCDVLALNSLLSAVSRHSRASEACELFHRARSSVPFSPDADTFAILLEGFEADSDPSGSLHTFHEMVSTLGWNPQNVHAYDSFLNTLLAAGDSSQAFKFYDLLRGHQCFPGPRFFRNALEHLVNHARDHQTTLSLWDDMVTRARCRPDTYLYNLMIAQQCDLDRRDAALRLLHDMVLDDGAFPDDNTYNLLLCYSVKSRHFRDAVAIFKEMVKNESLPTNANCADAIRFFLVSRDPDMAIRVWKCMVEKDIGPFEDTANYLVSELPQHFRLPEAVKYAEDMIMRGIKLNSSTLTRLKQNLTKVGKGPVYDELLSKWKVR